MLRIFIVLQITMFSSVSFGVCSQSGGGSHKKLIGGFTDLPYPPSPVQVRDSIEEYEKLSLERLDWMWLPDSWKEGISFPEDIVKAALDEGVIPVLRMIPDSVEAHPAKGPEPIYSLDRIASGDFDSELRSYAQKVATLSREIWISFGAEVNGDWFSWNGRWNGGRLGPQKFQQAYRHIIDIFREEKATDVCWVFHGHAQSSPQLSWNKMANYFPGEDYIDFAFLSVYGAIYRSDDTDWLSSMLEQPYAEISEFAPNTKIGIGEFGTTEMTDRFYKGKWINDAFETFINPKFSQLGAIGYWHESTWTNEKENNLRIDSSPFSLLSYRAAVKKARLGSK